jgi:hypothetical protein
LSFWAKDNKITLAFGIGSLGFGLRPSVKVVVEGVRPKAKGQVFDKKRKRKQCQHIPTKRGHPESPLMLLL